MVFQELFWFMVYLLDDVPRVAFPTLGYRHGRI
jgi:hypothetical protein